MQSPYLLNQTGHVKVWLKQWCYDWMDVSQPVLSDIGDCEVFIDNSMSGTQQKIAQSHNVGSVTAEEHGV